MDVVVVIFVADTAVDASASDATDAVPVFLALAMLVYVLL